MKTAHTPFLGIILWLALLLSACQPSSQQAKLIPDVLNPVPVQVTHTRLTQCPAREDRFVVHQLRFATGVRMREIGTYASNGAGLAVNDLDGDADLDLVLGSIDGESTILWNNGSLAFTPEVIEDAFTRSVNIVDVNGDGLLDIVFTHRGVEGVTYWRNQGSNVARRRFVRATLEGVNHYAYSMAWADLNGDGPLDLVTGAYDVDLKSYGVPEKESQERGGVVLYEQHNGRFTARQLAQRAETLAVGLVDLNGDGQRDIWAANDFALQDEHWLRRGDRWETSKPFGQTSHSTMSIDWGDLANDGRLALFTTDMNPGDISPLVLAAWLPVVSTLEEKHGPNDPQIMANMLQIGTGDGHWRNEAARRGVDATGWSWSGKFGDLDNDGFLDLYVVNGMIAENLFGHLPGSELVEENQVFRNQADGTFRPAREWDLASTASGRGMVMADLDNDGDLDIVVNNLRSQAQLFENRLCSGAAIEVDLSWPSSPNTHVIGAELELHTSLGVLRRDVRSASGYLSGDPSRVHFGFPTGTELKELVIRFPDGAAARVRSLEPQTLLKVSR